MHFADLLTPERIVVPLEVQDLRGALHALVQCLADSGSVRHGARSEELAQRILSGKDAESVRASEGILVVTARSDEVEDLTVALGVAPGPIAVDGSNGSGGAEAPPVRAVLLLLTPRRLSTLKVQVVPSLIRLLRDERRATRLLDAREPEDVFGFQELMAMELHERLLVEDALTPLTYRVYADTPLDEVVDLMVRRGLRAVPVVGEKYEVLGIITSGDALQHLLPRRMTGEGERPPPSREEPLRSRDVMTRSVMCVSEDQSLLEAANMMMNRGVDQLPVVREGELIGFVTRDTILGKLFGK